MKNTLTAVRDAVLIGLAWAVAWAPIAVIIGLTIIDPDNSMDEMWVVVGAYPGFLCGVIFSAVRALADGRRLAALSLPRAGAFGALSGMLVGVLPFTIGTPSTALPLWQWAAAVIGSFTLLSGISALVSVLIARSLKKRIGVRVV